MNIAPLFVITHFGALVNLLTSLDFARVYCLVINFESKAGWSKAMEDGKTPIARGEALANKDEELNEFF